MNKVDQLSVNTLRFLSVEAVQKANSGHPGLPMGAAPICYALWAKQMKHNPGNPNWPDRDRFILSAGHGSSLLYSLLHVFGYGLSLDELKNFRQRGSLTPGHPEYKHTVGVETTTGPLGQGVANAVGFAMAESHLGAKFNKPGYPVVDHRTYVFTGDGCLQEGVACEAISLAGTLGLGKLTLLYDRNQITIEGDIATTFDENVGEHFVSNGWHVQEVADGNDVDAIATAIASAKEVADKPSVIIINTQIGYGAPNKQGKASAHGEPLGEEEIKGAKEKLGWTYSESFYVPEEVKQYMEEVKAEGAKKEAAWNTLFDNYAKEYPELAKEWKVWFSDELPADFLNDEDFWSYEGNLATRAASEKVLQKVAAKVPNLIGGSADLGPSNKSVMKDREYYSKDMPEGSNIHFGIREFAMSAIANAMAIHGGLRPYTACFFVFSDYMKSGLRMSALMSSPVINLFTHDSIGVGEDGPTHQPIEQLAALRSIPNYTVIRPCDSHETAAAWYAALTRKSPTGLVLSRQNLTLLPETGKGALKGAYILKDSKKAEPDMILMASGSEVELIYKAWDSLQEKGVDARIVSMPSWELFEEQTDEYKESVLPKAVRKRLAVEAGSDFGWHKYIGLDGAMVCRNTFGASAPAGELFKEFGFTVENVVEKALELAK